jgi:GMP reductase
VTKIDNELLLDFRDVLIRPKRSTLASRNDVVVSRKFTFKHTGSSFTGFPVIAANMDGVGTFSMARALNAHDMTVALRKGYTIEQFQEFFRQPGSHKNWFTIGITDRDIDILHAMMDDMVNRPINLCIDVANGYTERFVDTIKKIRDRYGSLNIMAGNVVTGDMTEALILAGADVVKVGIGPGSVCTTRKMAGVGYPQLSAILECADAAHGLGGLICADGGCQVPGDIAKAFGAGADFVMLGGMLAGHEEGEYQLQYVDAEDGGWVRSGRAVKAFATFYGMSSDEAQRRNSGEIKDYRASEGKVVRIPFKGPVEPTIREIKGGVRSAMTYIGAATLKEMSKRTTFVRVSQQLNPMFGDGAQA